MVSPRIFSISALRQSLRRPSIRGQVAAVIFAFGALLLAFLSPLAFVPVPWPDDSAFYFVAKSLFDWPPRWVMLPQAPFEPSYAEWNFNTMPLYPILIGLGRLVGIDGSHALKLWPLGFWALSGAMLGIVLIRKGLPRRWALVLAAGFLLNPTARWASTLIRPESLIGLLGLVLVLGLTFGWPKRLEPRRYWDPEAALLAAAAYAHFNAVHLLFPVVAYYLIVDRGNVRRLVRIAGTTLLYLLPWLLTILLRPQLFWQQMRTQWTRLAVPNEWLSQGFVHALEEVFQQMGNPEPFSWAVLPAAVILFGIVFTAVVWGVREGTLRTRKRPSLIPAAAWIVGALWLWHTKPEVWFIYFFHLAAFTWLGIAALRSLRTRAPHVAICAAIAALALLCAEVTADQLVSLSLKRSWRWSTYRQFIGCIDRALVAVRARHPQAAPFRVWDPTYPDVTIELSRRHPDWEFSRTNDFWARRHLALAHAHTVEAVVVPETINLQERWIEGPQADYPQIQSVWMNWDGYFLYPLLREDGWKPYRSLCQAGRWQAFIYSR